MNALRLGLSFLTRLPIPPRMPEAGELGRSVRAWPIAGAIVAVASLIGLTAGSWLVNPLVGAVGGIGGMMWITGAFHVDGLSDSIDGLLCNGSPERRLEVMHDPRVGALGAAWTSLWLILRVALLSACVEAGTALPAIWAACVLSRAALPLEILGAPAATPGKGLFSSMKAQLRRRDAVLCLVVAAVLLAPIVILFPEQRRALGAGVILAGAVTLGWAQLWRGLVGGLNGDTLGAAVELREAAILACLASRVLA